MFQSEMEPRDPLARRQMMTTLLQDTIMMLCKNMIKYDLELSVEGLLGVTVDRKEVVLINIKELVTAEVSLHSSPGPASNSASNPTSVSNSAFVSAFSEDSSEVPQSKRKRPRLTRPTIASEHEMQSTAKPPLSSVQVIGRGGEEKILNRGDEVTITIGNDDELEGGIKRERVMSDVSNVDRRAAINFGGKSHDSEQMSSTEHRLDDDTVYRETRQPAWSTSHKTVNRLNKNVVVGGDGFANLSHEVNDDDDDVIPAIKDEPGDGKGDLINVEPKHSRVSSLKSYINQDVSSQSTSWVPVMFNPEESINESSPLPAVDVDPTDLDNICCTTRDANGALCHHCVVCAQTFSARHHVRRHFNSQHSCAPEHHFCQLCGAAFRRLDVMRRHVKSVHKEVDDGSAWLNLDTGGGNGAVV